MVGKYVSFAWSAGKDSYHLQQTRQQFPESEYINALAQAIQEVKPEACYREAMRKANIVDEHTVGVLGSQE